MSIVGNKITELNSHIAKLNKLSGFADGWRVDQGTDFEAVVKEAEEIVKLASFLVSYKDLDNEREKDVKEIVMNYLNKNNTYDSAFIKSIGYCFGECD